MLVFAFVVCAVSSHAEEVRLTQHQHLRRAALSANESEVDDDAIREAQEEVKQAEQKLYANLHETRVIKQNLAQADNKTGQLQEVEEHVKIVANETTSDSLARFLGDYWTEMHTFARPLYKEELKDQLEDLTDDLPQLEKNLGNAKDALANAYDVAKVVKEEEKADMQDEAEVKKAKEKEEQKDGKKEEGKEEQKLEEKEEEKEALESSKVAEKAAEPAKKSEPPAPAAQSAPREMRNARYFKAAPEPVNKFHLALISSLGLGSFGCDRCLMGQTTVGVVKFVTLGGCGIWACVDWIVITANCLMSYQSMSAAWYWAVFQEDTIAWAFWATVAVLVAKLGLYALEVYGVVSFSRKVRGNIED